MKKTIDVGFGLLEIYDDIAIGIINEGADLGKAHEHKIFEALEDYYSGRPFAYISRRKNSYSFNPIMHKTSTNIVTDLVSYAVVANTAAQKLSFSIEQIFIDKPFQFFFSMEDAMEWTRTQLTTNAINRKDGMISTHSAE